MSNLKYSVITHKEHHIAEPDTPVRNMYSVLRTIEDVIGKKVQTEMRIWSKVTNLDYEEYGDIKLFTSRANLETHVNSNEVDYTPGTQRVIDLRLAASDREKSRQEKAGLSYTVPFDIQLINRDDGGGSYIKFTDNKLVSGRITYVHDYTWGGPWFAFAESVAAVLSVPYTVYRIIEQVRAVFSGEGVLKSSLHMTLALAITAGLLTDFQRRKVAYDRYLLTEVEPLVESEAANTLSNDIIERLGEVKIVKLGDR